MADFTYTANVKCVNGTDRWLELLFTNYAGVLADDITEITVTGPSGLITNNINDFEIFEDTDFMWFATPALVPELGTYNFSVTIGGETVLGSDEQTVNRSLDSVSPATMVPVPDSSVPTDTTFEWGAIADPGFPVYYGIQIRNAGGEYVANVRYVGDFTYDINLPAGNYTWQIIVMDGVGWKENNNRTHGPWQNFTIV